MKKKILFFHIEFPAGGAERVTLDIANYISAYDYEVYVLANKARELYFSNIKIIETPERFDADSLINAEFIVKTINDLSIDIFVLPVIILSHMEYIKSKTHCKLVFSLHSVPFWEVLSALYDKKKRARHSLVRKIIWLLLTCPKALWIKKYDKPVIAKHRKMYELVDAYTVLCEGYKQIVLNKIISPWEGDRIHVIPNSERIPTDIDLSQKKKQILFVGRMSYEDKRVDRLVDIWAMIYKEVPDWELILVGDGPEREILQNKVQKMQLQHIRFIGYSHSVHDYYQEASILCLTSTFEGWPLCLTEAQAHGVVPVAFDCTAGVHEVLSPSGVNGFLIPPFKKKLYAHILLRLLNNPSKIEEMRQNVILKSKQYSPEIIGGKWLTLFDSLL